MAASRRRHVGNAPKRATQRVNLQVDTEAYQRLLLHSIMSKEQPGALVSRLIDEHLRDWRVQRNPSARDGGNDRLELVTEARESMPEAA